MQLEQDIEFVKSVLPSHYEVKESSHKGSVHCKSPIGIRYQDTDIEDEEHWEWIVDNIQEKFGARFMEIDHNTCFCHVDFTVYLR